MANDQPVTAAKQEDRSLYEDIQTETRGLAKRASRAADGGIALSSLRGKHAGWVECCEFLDTCHPRVAAKLRDHFGLDEKGNLGGSRD